MKIKHCKKMSILNKSSILLIRSVRHNMGQHVRYLSLSRSIWNQTEKTEKSVAQASENQQLQTSFSKKGIHFRNKKN